MKITVSLFIFLSATLASYSQTCNVTTLYGWATQNGGTTGGEGGTSVVVSTSAELSTALAKPGKYIIYVKGILTSFNVFNVTSDKTIFGLPGATIEGYLNLVGVSNIILKNLTIRGEQCASYNLCKAGIDAVHIEGGTHHVWLDHMDIADGQDGNCDITHACDFITISWTKFHYTYLKQHAFSNLIGHVDGNTEDIGKLKVTLHHNWWADNVMERQPRVRYGKVHIANNLYTSTSSTYIAGAGDSANILVEGNIMKYLVSTPIETSFNGVTNYSAILARNNIGATGFNQVKNTAFVPPYQMPVEPTANLEATIRNCAGATLKDPTIINGLNESSLESLVVTPNPFTNEINMVIPEGYTYFVTDLQGRILISGNENVKSYNTAHFQSGMYFLTLNKDGMKVKTIKMQKLY